MLPRTTKDLSDSLARRLLESIGAEADADRGLVTNHGVVSRITRRRVFWEPFNTTTPDEAIREALEIVSIPILTHVLAVDRCHQGHTSMVTASGALRQHERSWQRWTQC
ncbi:MAG TPA: hypothetical protein VF595_09000 [Tepidisphaeraceae bacterium]|jgi:hypothetical protein